MKKVLITGGAGFIGSNLALKLIDKGYDVTVLDNLSKQIHGDDPENTSPLYKSIAGKVNFIKGSVTSAADLTTAIEGQNVIIHLAAETGTGQSMYQIAHYTNINIGGTALLLDILANAPHNITKLIVASSRAIYGEGKYWSEELGFVYPGHRNDGDMKAGHFNVKYPECINDLQAVATDEESKIHPSSLYGITKQNQEQIIMTICPTIGIAPVAFRYQNVYGPGQSLANPYTGILSIFSNLIKNDKEINVFEDGKETRDFVFIDDAIDSIILGIEADEANNEIFNVGTGVPTDVITVVNELLANYEKEVPVKISGNYRLGDIRHNFADLTKISTKLGFKPVVDFKAGIRQFAKWVNAQDAIEDKYERSIQEMKGKGLFR